jgi:hypothetical protein
MEADAARADPILEGAPTGVMISERDDPSTFLNFCTGTGEPLADPDDLTDRSYGDGHYTGCPIWAAGRELDALGRAFSPPERGELPEGAEVAPQRIVDEEWNAFMAGALDG